MANAAGPAAVDVGAIRLTFLPDGVHHADPAQCFPGVEPEVWRSHADLLDGSGRLLMTLGAFLVETAGRRVLVDTAFGARRLEYGTLDFAGGALVDSLRAAGVGPSEVDAVVYTHLHLDHMGWTLDAADPARLTFPGAEHHVARAEWEHWVGRFDVGGPTEAEAAALGTRVQLFDGELTPAPGVTVVPTPGHTPGHCSVVVSSGTERALILGDAIHCPLQIANPEWEFMSDVDPALAVRTRARVVAELESPGTVGADAHFPESVFGRVLPGRRPRQWLFHPPSADAATPS